MKNPCGDQIVGEKSLNYENCAMTRCWFVWVVCGERNAVVIGSVFYIATDTHEKVNIT